MKYLFNWTSAIIIGLMTTTIGAFVLNHVSGKKALIVCSSCLLILVFVYVYHIIAEKECENNQIVDSELEE